MGAGDGPGHDRFSGRMMAIFPEVRSYLGLGRRGAMRKLVPTYIFGQVDERSRKPSCVQRHYPKTGCNGPSVGP